MQVYSFQQERSQDTIADLTVRHEPTLREQLLAIAQRFQASLPELRKRVTEAQEELAAAQRGILEARAWAAELTGARATARL